MTAYLIADIEVTDPSAFEDYRARVGAVIAQYGGRYIVRGGAVRALEGDFGFQRLVVLEFPSAEAAQRFYDSPEYAPLLALRSASTRSLVSLVEGYAPG